VLGDGASRRGNDKCGRGGNVEAPGAIASGTAGVDQRPHFGLHRDPVRPHDASASCKSGSVRLSNAKCHQETRSLQLRHFSEHDAVQRIFEGFRIGGGAPEKSLDQFRYHFAKPRLFLVGGARKTKKATSNGLPFSSI
jgi:hypothetical protein